MTAPFSPIHNIDTSFRSLNIQELLSAPYTNSLYVSKLYITFLNVFQDHVEEGKHHSDLICNVEEREKIKMPHFIYTSQTS